MADLRAQVRELQHRLGIAEDGIVGPDFLRAVDEALDRQHALEPPPIVIPAVPAPRRKIAWGAKVSQTFRDRVWWMADQSGRDPDDFMTIMAWESGRSFSPSKKNLAGSGATGLIQFMPNTAVSMGTTTAALATMTAEDQLSYVWKYFQPFLHRAHDLSDLYMAVLWPRAVGKPDDYVLFRGGTITFRQNAGLDTDRNRIITKSEVSKKLYDMRTEGLRPENMA